MFLEKKDLLEGFCQRIESARAEVRKTHQTGAHGYETVRALCQFVDGWVADYFQHTCAEPEIGTPLPAAVVAVGGYGRGELNPGSDIDLLVVVERAGDARTDLFVKKFQYWFYDTGLKIGYQFIPLNSANNFIQDDVKTRAALLEARFLCGEKALFDLFMEKVKRSIGQKPQQFYQAYLQELVLRKKEHGETVYVQEPDVKNGLGGLRDFHFACWVAKPMLEIYQLDTYAVIDAFAERGVLWPDEAQRLKHALSYLWWLRSEIHFQAGGKDLNLLSCDLQQKISLAFGQALLPFMNNTYRYMWDVHSISMRIIERAMAPGGKSLFSASIQINNQVMYIVDPKFFVAHPDRMLKVFEQCKQQGLRLSAVTLACIEQALPHIDDAYRADRHNNQIFLAVFSTTGKGRSADVLRMMSESGFLGAFMPEWQAITGLVQDARHRYTVQEHTLQALERLQHLYDLEKEAQDVKMFETQELQEALAFLKDLNPEAFRQLEQYLLGHEAQGAQGLTQMAEVFRHPRSLLFSQSLQNVAAAVESTLDKLNAIIQILEYSGIPSLLQLVPFLRDPNIYEMVNELEEIKNPLLLWLALLFHDIGKTDPYDHHREGRAIAARYLERWGIVGRDAKKVDLLIKLHTRMTGVCRQDYLRRSDLLSSFAEEVVSIDRLRMLYILTYCDMGSVAQKVWDKYNAGAIRLLFENTEKKLIEGFDVLNHKRVIEKRREVLEILKKDIPEKHVLDHIAQMPDIYFHNLTTFDLSQHIRMVEAFLNSKRKSLVIYEPNHLATYYEVVVAARSYMGLLAHVVGVFSYLGFNIRQVQIYTRNDGVIVDVFRLDRPKRQKHMPGLTLARLRRLVEKVISERDNHLRIKLGRRKSGKVPTEIGFDNTVTNRCTIVSVYSSDRLGLLYHVAHVLTEEKLDISYARIRTEGNMAMDAFYVTDRLGKAVSDEKRLAVIEKHLRHVIDQ